MQISYCAGVGASNSTLSKGHLQFQRYQTSDANPRVEAWAFGAQCQLFPGDILSVGVWLFRHVVPREGKCHMFPMLCLKPRAPFLGWVWLPQPRPAGALAGRDTYRPVHPRDLSARIAPLGDSFGPWTFTFAMLEGVQGP